MRKIILFVFALFTLQSCQNNCECWYVENIDDHDANGLYNVLYENSCSGELIEIEYEVLPRFESTNQVNYNNYSTVEAKQMNCDV